MCLYSKTIYQCNHSANSPSPFQACHLQQEFELGLLALPCDEVTTHGRNTVRIPQLCQYCHEKKISVERRFNYAKNRLAELRKHLEETYGECMRHLDEVGVEPVSPSSETSSETSSSSNTTYTTVESEASDTNSSETSASTEDDLDPVQEFLRKKMLESDAHLMMFY
ncbi:hypothetical protein F4819DRAFT_506328 [Hypoxylon fuscum]|nr:hypothetical protein F4819DRAFT_506328 [Hypoxylon fuscum]